MVTPALRAIRHPIADAALVVHCQLAPFTVPLIGTMNTIILTDECGDSHVAVLTVMLPC